MKTIHKYILENEMNEIDMPQGAYITEVREQHGNVCMWALVDTSRKAEQRKFLVVGTGFEIPFDGIFVRGSAHLAGGALVLHVVEVL